jgi:hypothetical protein
MTTPTLNEDIHKSDLKEEVEMDEIKAGQEQADHTQIDLVSNYASMPRTPAIRKFWRLFLMGVLVTSAGLYSGYTTSLPGAIVGNKGEHKKPSRLGNSALDSLSLYRALSCFPLICHPKHKGFIDQFATVTNDQGVRVLDANYVGLWSAMNYVSQAVSQFGSPLTAQKFGIRFNLYLFTLLKLVVSRRVALVEPSHIQSELCSYSAESFPPPPHADDHHRDLLYGMVAFPARQAVQRFRRRADRYLRHVVRFGNRHVTVQGDRPFVLRLLFRSGTIGQCDWA